MLSRPNFAQLDEPLNICTFGSFSFRDTPDGSALRAKLLLRIYYILRSACRAQELRVSVARCTPCAYHHNSTVMMKYFPAAVKQNVLNIYSERFPAYHTRDDDSTPLQHLEVDKIPGHQSIRG